MTKIPSEVPVSGEKWQPQIVAIVCNWCTYAGADMAGTTRRVYPASVRMMRVPCSGRINPLFLIKAFEQGADGVLVSGCHPGDCHYVQGNYFARRRFTAYRALMHFLGLDPRRLHFSWVSASEGIKWARVVEEVTAKVTEAGPLRDWGKVSETVSAKLPDPPKAPRGLPPKEEMEAVGKHLRGLADDLFKGGKIAWFVGYREGSLPGQMIPAIIGPEDSTEVLAFNERCHSNLSVYLAGPRGLTGKIAVVVKACDAKAVVGFLQEKKIQRENVTLIGVSCPGVFEKEKLAPKCFPCNGEVPSLCDFTVTGDGVKTGAVKSGKERATAADPRDAEIAHLESLSPGERWAFWQSQFDVCLRCYACRSVCPLCYCGSCITEHHRPQWISTAINGEGNTAWNIIRAYHLAGRCIGCDQCSRVCPAQIRLDLINRRVAMEIKEAFGYQAGCDEKQAPPLAAFKPDDPQEFIY